MKQVYLSILFFLFVAMVSAQPVAKFNWAKAFTGTSGSDGCTAITTDKAGNVYATGWFVGTVDFNPNAADTFNLVSAGGQDAFITKMDAAGNLIWAKKIGGTSTDYIYAMALDTTGNIYLTGAFGGYCDFDTDTAHFNLHATGSTDIFVAKLDTGGHLLWAKKVGSGVADKGFAIAVDAQGNSFTAGSFGGAPDFNPSPSASAQVTATGLQDGFILKLNTLGNFIWVKSFSGSGNSNCFVKNILLDKSGNIYTAGSYMGTIDANPGAGMFALSAADSTDIFISKLNSTGNFMWAKTIGSSSADVATGLVIDSFNHLYLSGNFTDSLNFNLPSGNKKLMNGSGFITRMDTAGSFIFANTIGHDCAAIVLDNAGNVYTTGSFMGTVDFDPSPSAVYNLQSAYTVYPKHEDFDVYVCRLDSSGKFNWAVNFGAAHKEVGQAITIDAGLHVYTAGSFLTTPNFNIGAGIYQPYNAGYFTDVFIHKMSQCNPLPTIRNSAAVDTVCSGNAVVLKASGLGFVTWYNKIDGGTVLATGSAYDVTLIAPTTTFTKTYFAEAANACSSPVSFQVTVKPLPSSWINSSGDSLIAFQTGASYQWFICNDTLPYIIPGATNQFYIPNVTANYGLTVSQNGCTATSSKCAYVAVYNATGINELMAENGKLLLYPNPTKELLVISYQLLGNTKIQICDVLGRVVYHSERSEESKSKAIRVANLASGVYMVKVTDEKGNSMIGKFVKE